MTWRGMRNDVERRARGRGEARGLIDKLKILHDQLRALDALEVIPFAAGGKNNVHMRNRLARRALHRPLRKRIRALVRPAVNEFRFESAESVLIRRGNPHDAFLAARAVRLRTVPGDAHKTAHAVLPVFERSHHRAGIPEAVVPDLDAEPPGPALERNAPAEELLEAHVAHDAPREKISARDDPDDAPGREFRGEGAVLEPDLFRGPVVTARSGKCRVAIVPDPLTRTSSHFIAGRVPERDEPRNLFRMPCSEIARGELITALDFPGLVADVKRSPVAEVQSIGERFRRAVRRFNLFDNGVRKRKHAGISVIADRDENGMRFGVYTRGAVLTADMDVFDTGRGNGAGKQKGQRARGTGTDH